MITKLLLASILVSVSYGLDNGLGLTPKMGIDEKKYCTIDSKWYSSSFRLEQLV